MECMPSRKRGSCSEPIGESIYLKPLFIRGNKNLGWALLRLPRRATHTRGRRRRSGGVAHSWLAGENSRNQRGSAPYNISDHTRHGSVLRSYQYSRGNPNRNGNPHQETVKYVIIVPNKKTRKRPILSACCGACHTAGPNLIFSVRRRGKSGQPVTLGRCCSAR